MRIINRIPQMQFTAALILLLFPLLLSSQQRFRAGAVLGLTASQIDGDQSAGYNKLGLQSGLRVIGRLTKRTDASLEFLFSQRGAQQEFIKDRFIDQNPITLNYVEIPVQWHFKDWLIEGDDESENYYKVSFNAGLSYARLISTKHKGGDETSWFRLGPDIKKNDFSFVLGANFFVNRHWGFTVRYNRSINYMYDPRDHTIPLNPSALQGHCLYFQTVYIL